MKWFLSLVFHWALILFINFFSVVERGLGLGIAFCERIGDDFSIHEGESLHWFSFLFIFLSLFHLIIALTYLIILSQYYARIVVRVLPLIPVVQFVRGLGIFNWFGMSNGFSFLQIDLIQFVEKVFSLTQGSLVDTL